VVLPNPSAASLIPVRWTIQALDGSLRFGYTNESPGRYRPWPGRHRAIGSMGTDTPWLFFPTGPQPCTIFQAGSLLRSQSAIDALRENIVTSSALYLGAEGNLVDPHPDNCRCLPPWNAADRRQHLD
jgi:hypothetical protein